MAPLIGRGAFGTIDLGDAAINGRGLRLVFGAAVVALPVASVVAIFIGRAGQPVHSSALERSLEPLSEAEQRLVLNYVEAYQEGDCEAIIAMTAWMGERLEYVRATTSDTNAVAQAKDDLCAELQERPVEGNHVSPAGIEDKYLLPPGARVRLLGRDSGGGDLESPVAFRAWVAIAYPVDRYAPRDETGRTIRSLAVGINFAPGGFVLKADVAGNLEVVRESFEHKPQGMGG